MAENTNSNARAATLEQLRKTTLANYLDPVPSNETLRSWFSDAKIPHFKANHTAKRGGGPCYYSVPHVEKLLRSRTLIAA